MILKGNQKFTYCRKDNLENWSKTTEDEQMKEVTWHCYLSNLKKPF